MPSNAAPPGETLGRAGGWELSRRWSARTGPDRPTAGSLRCPEPKSQLAAKSYLLMSRSSRRERTWCTYQLMPNEPKLGFGERVAIAGIVAGLAGTVAAMALPLAYPDMPASVWRLIFWPSLVVMVVAIIFFLGDLIAIRLEQAGPANTPKARAIFAVLCLVGTFGVGGWYVLTIPPQETADATSSAEKQSGIAR